MESEGLRLLETGIFIEKSSNRLHLVIFLSPGSTIQTCLENLLLLFPPVFQETELTSMSVGA